MYECAIYNCTCTCTCYYCDIYICSCFPHLLSDPGPGLTCCGKQRALKIKINSFPCTFATCFMYENVEEIQV